VPCQQALHLIWRAFRLCGFIACIEGHLPRLPLDKRTCFETHHSRLSFFLGCSVSSKGLHDKWERKERKRLLSTRRSPPFPCPLFFKSSDHRSRSQNHFPRFGKSVCPNQGLLEFEVPRRCSVPISRLCPNQPILHQSRLCNGTASNRYSSSHPRFAQPLRQPGSRTPAIPVSAPFPANFYPAIVAQTLSDFTPRRPSPTIFPLSTNFNTSQPQPQTLRPPETLVRFLHRVAYIL